MNHCIRDMEWEGTLRYNSRKYKFDYLEPDNFFKLQQTADLSVIGSIKLSPIDKDANGDKIIIADGLNDHYFRLVPLKTGKRIPPRKLIGYAMVGNSIYVAVYKKKKLTPVILILTLFCFLVFILQ